jgi:hypothetical protein
MNPPSLRDATSQKTTGRDRFHPVLDSMDGVEAVPTSNSRGNLRLAGRDEFHLVLFDFDWFTHLWTPWKASLPS